MLLLLLLLVLFRKDCCSLEVESVSIAPLTEEEEEEEAAAEEVFKLNILLALSFSSAVSFALLPSNASTNIYRRGQQQ